MMIINMENIKYKKNNFIRSLDLNQLEFSTYLRDLEGEYLDLSYYTYLYVGYPVPKFLNNSRIWKKKCQFLINKNQDTSLFSDPTWWQYLSFIVHITKHLYDLTLTLQGKDYEYVWQSWSIQM